MAIFQKYDKNFMFYLKQWILTIPIKVNLVYLS